MASATGGLAVLEAEPEQGLFGGPDGVLPGLLKSSKDAKPDRASDANAILAAKDAKPSRPAADANTVLATKDAKSQGPARAARVERIDWYKHRPATGATPGPPGAKVASWIEPGQHPHVVWHQRLLPGADARPLRLVLSRANAGIPEAVSVQRQGDTLEFLCDATMRQWLSVDLVGGTHGTRANRQTLLNALLSDEHAFPGVPLNLALKAQPLCLTAISNDTLFTALSVARGALVFDTVNPMGVYRGLAGCPRVREVMSTLARLADKDTDLFYEQLGWMAHRCLVVFSAKGLLLKLSWLYLLLELDLRPAIDLAHLASPTGIAGVMAGLQLTLQDLACRLVLLIRLTAALQCTSNETHWHRFRQDTHSDCTELAREASAWHTYTQRLATSG